MRTVQFSLKRLSVSGEQLLLKWKLLDQFCRKYRSSDYANEWLYNYLVSFLLTSWYIIFFLTGGRWGCWEMHLYSCNYCSSKNELFLFPYFSRKEDSISARICHAYFSSSLPVTSNRRSGSFEWSFTGSHCCQFWSMSFCKKKRERKRFEEQEVEAMRYRGAGAKSCSVGMWGRLCARWTWNSWDKKLWYDELHSPFLFQCAFKKNERASEIIPKNRFWKSPEMQFG